MKAQINLSHVASHYIALHQVKISSCTCQFNQGVKGTPWFNKMKYESRKKALP